MAHDRLRVVTCQDNKMATASKWRHDLLVLGSSRNIYLYVEVHLVASAGCIGQMLVPLGFTTYV